jgi:hypothetical protein
MEERKELGMLATGLMVGLTEEKMEEVEEGLEEKANSDKATEKAWEEDYLMDRRNKEADFVVSKMLTSPERLFYIVIVVEKDPVSGKVLAWVQLNGQPYAVLRKVVVCSVEGIKWAPQKI